MAKIDDLRADVDYVYPKWGGVNLRFVAQTADRFAVFRYNDEYGKKSILKIKESDLEDVKKR